MRDPAWTVSCDVCKAAGPEMPSRSEAVLAWNRIGIPEVQRPTAHALTLSLIAGQAGVSPEAAKESLRHSPRAHDLFHRTRKIVKEILRRIGYINEPSHESAQNQKSSKESVSNDD